MFLLLLGYTLHVLNRPIDHKYKHVVKLNKNYNLIFEKKYLLYKYNVKRINKYQEKSNHI